MVGAGLGGGDGELMCHGTVSVSEDGKYWSQMVGMVTQ